MDDLPVPTLNTLADLLASRFQDFVDVVSQDLADKSNPQGFEAQCKIAQMYSYLLHWMIEGAEQRWRKEKKEKAVVLPSAAGKNKVCTYKKRGIRLT